MGLGSASLALPALGFDRSYAWGFIWQLLPLRGRVGHMLRDVRRRCRSFLGIAALAKQRPPKPDP